MKKIFLTMLVFLMTTLYVNAATYDPVANVSTVGNNLTSKNGLPSITYSVVDTETANSNIYTTKKLYITKNKLTYCGNNNELAAIISYELGLVINTAISNKDMVNNTATSLFANISNENLQNAATMAQKLAINNISVKEQMNADIIGTNLMIKAGYNPLATIVVLGKMEGSVTDSLKMQPNNFKRTMNIYDYLAYNYPDKVKAGYSCNEYRTFLAYIQPTLDKRNSDKKAMTNYQQEQAKAKQERTKQLTKYKATNGNNPWVVLDNLIKSKGLTTTK